ncbi:MAG: hypothetical protein GXY83_43920, partial [Rhodopirellula sp.]|nr:hypothetical protein [Rhodopirellula sp.]
ASMIWGVLRSFSPFSVFSLFDGSMSPVEYLLSDEGIGSGGVTVTEVSESGSVPDLLVENKGDVRVLFLEGEEYRAQQGDMTHPARRHRPDAVQNAASE